jgi:AraC-like DNA-binding protein
LKLILVSLALLASAAAFGQYERFLHLPYAATMDSLDGHLGRIEAQHVGEAAEVAEWNRVRDFARQHRDLRLELGVECYFAHIYRYKYGQPADVIERYRSIIDRADRAGQVEMHATCLHTLASIYFEAGNYEASFAACLELEKLLAVIPDTSYPDKMHAYVAIAYIFYAFREYTATIAYLEKAVSITVVERNRSAYADALNTLGLCYIEQNKPDSAEVYFSRIIDDPLFADPAVAWPQTWRMIARKNMADLQMMRNDYAAAVPLYTTVAAYMRMIENESAFAAGASIALADAFVRLNDRAAADRLFGACLRRDSIPDSRLGEWYDVHSRYDAFTGNYPDAIAYRDSAEQVEKASLERFNTMRLLRVQQRLSEEEWTAALATDRAFRRSMLFLVTGLTLFFAGATVAFYFFGKRREARRALVRTNKRWAGIETSDTHEGLGEPAEPDVYDMALMKRIEQLMAERKLYTRVELTLDDVAAALSETRNAVSQSVNRCRQKNFKTYLNEYRIKNAMIILAEDVLRDTTIEGIAFDSGFGDRKTFHRVFKSVTGLSPAEFTATRKK